MMKSNMVLRMFVILVLTVLCVSAGVYAIVNVTTTGAVTDDIRERAIGVKDIVLDSLDADDFTDIGGDSEAGLQADRHTQEILSQFRGVGSLTRLYLAREDEAGNIVTSSGYIPSGNALRDLHKSITENVAVLGGGVYRNEDGNGIYTIFWPVMNSLGWTLGVVCMEFDVDTVYRSQSLAANYSIALAGALIVMFSVIAYLSMNRASEPYYKKLAYTDILTGYENRMAFEHALRECGDIAQSGGRVTLIVFDVNNLKTVNDKQGHKAGDLYLKITADIIHENLKGLGSLYRIGGDEYAAIIAGKTEADDEAVLDALRSEDRETVKNQPFSCAFGAATFTPGTDESMKDTFKRADEAMYEEKKRQKAILGQDLR